MGTSKQQYSFGGITLLVALKRSLIDCWISMSLLTMIRKREHELQTASNWDVLFVR